MRVVAVPERRPSGLVGRQTLVRVRVRLDPLEARRVGRVLGRVVHAHLPTLICKKRF